MKAFLLVAAVACAGFAQQAGRPSPSSGPAMYRAYCASCHGVSGKGDGPAATALKRQPADLTALAGRHGGRFPSVRVFQSIEGDASIAAHGSREMPVWGAVFRQIGGSDEAAVKLRVRNLVRYIESIQTGAAGSHKQ
ncbi:MAG TPA: cytochrome c [Bryobacteraceae bacterium]|nr:cytochrome c [Bryobacteraceae bacterium]